MAQLLGVSALESALIVLLTPSSRAAKPKPDNKVSPQL